MNALKVCPDCGYRDLKDRCIRCDAKMTEHVNDIAFIAWHPVNSYKLSTIDYQQVPCERKLTGYAHLRHKTSHEDKLKRKLEKGWIIKKVKITEIK